MVPSRIASGNVPGVLHVIPPKTPAAPIVFDSPHSGLTLPAGFRPAVDEKMVRRASDTYVDELFGAAPEFGAPFLVAEFPRSYLDVNRALHDVDVSMIEGSWPYPAQPGPAAKRGMGLAWKYAWGDVLMHDAPISVAEMEHRIDAFWRPYHARLKALLDEAHREHGQVYHVNCHSMPAFGHALSPDPPGTARADFVIGDRDGTTCDPDFVECVCETAKGLGYRVKRNEPFKGAELVRAYSNPALGRHSVQIELNRGLYMDEETRKKTRGFSQLQRDLTLVIERLSTYARDRIR